MGEALAAAFGGHGANPGPSPCQVCVGLQGLPDAVHGARRRPAEDWRVRMAWMVWGVRAEGQGPQTTGSFCVLHWEAQRSAQSESPGPSRGSCCLCLSFPTCSAGWVGVWSLAGTWCGYRPWHCFLLFSPRFCMVYSEVPNFSEPNPEYVAQQSQSKAVSAGGRGKQGAETVQAPCGTRLAPGGAETSPPCLPQAQNENATPAASQTAQGPSAPSPGRPGHRGPGTGRDATHGGTRTPGFSPLYEGEGSVGLEPGVWIPSLHSCHPLGFQLLTARMAMG